MQSWRNCFQRLFSNLRKCEMRKAVSQTAQVPLTLPMGGSCAFFSSPRTQNQRVLTHCSRGKYRVRLLPASVTTFLSTNQFIILCYTCFYLKTPYLINLVDSLTLNSWSTARSLLLAWCISNIDFLHEACHSLPALRKAIPHSPGTVLNSEIASNMRKTWHQGDQERDTL